MPRVSADGKTPDWGRLYELAAPQGGYFSAGQAKRAGYSAQLLQYYVSNGHLERAGRGVCRLVHFPAGENEDLVVAWLWSEGHGIVSHDTALALHQLSDVLPGKAHLTVPEQWRARRLRVPKGLVLHFADIPKRDVAWMGPVPVTRPLRTLHDCIEANVPVELTRQALKEGLAKGVFARSDARELRQAMNLHAKRPAAESPA